MEKVKKIANQQQLSDVLDSDIWDELCAKLMARSVVLLRRKYGVRWSNDKMTKYCNDRISEIIDKVFIEKTRIWNITAYPTFQEFIENALDSHINNNLNKQNPEISAVTEYMFDSNGETDSYIEEKIIAKELEDQIYNEFERLGASDDELLVFECIKEGICKPQKIREELGIDEDDFKNIWRTFKRKQNSIKETLSVYGY